MPHRSMAARSTACSTPTQPRRTSAIRPGALAISGPKVTIGLVADYDYFLTRGADLARAQAEALSTMNAALAVLAEQLGISFEISSLDVYTSRDQDPFPESIGDLAEILEAMPSIIPGTSAIHHLITGKEDAFKSVVGIAYGASLCGPFSYSVTQEIHPSMDFLVAAHELAHNLGAAHDESSESLMFPSVLPTTFVSELSRSEIRAHLSSVSCLPAVDFEPPPVPTVSPFPALVTFDTRAELRGSGKLDVRIELGGDIDPNGLASIELGLTQDMETVIASTAAFPTDFTTRLLEVAVATPKICKKRQKRKRGCVTRKKAKRRIPPVSDRVIYARVKLLQYRATTTHLGSVLAIPIFSAGESGDSYTRRLASLLDRAIAGVRSQ